LLTLAGFSARPTFQELIPADYLMQQFVQRARGEARLGPQVPVTDDLFTQIRESIKDYPTVCTKPHLKSVTAYTVPSTAKNWHAVALSGRGLCYCSMIGNCRLWIYRQKNGKLHKLFAADSASAFAFLPSRAGTPLLVVWTRESAVEQFVFVYKLDFGEYIEAASWKELYQYEADDEEFRVHDTPKIYSTMPLGSFLPD
jgi:hypothetical protein